MKRCVPLFYFWICLANCLTLRAQDTFSIVALDPATGEIGSAGASCLDENLFPGSGGAYIISDILPGRGAIHTQSFWIQANQQNARARMLEGLSPQAILDWLKANDPEGPFNAQRRQYGIVDFDPVNGGPRAAAFTGTLCFDHKAHIVAPTYAIQGNILLGQAILDSMEARFLNTPGTLAEKLMASLQGAKVPGADTRCLSNGVSSLSAFVRVARPDDLPGAFYLDLNVPSLPAGREPIDSLQTLFDQWLSSSVPSPSAPALLSLSPNPAQGRLFLDSWGAGVLVLYDLRGVEAFRTEVTPGRQTLQPTLTRGVYLYDFWDQKNARRSSGKLVWAE